MQKLKNEQEIIRTEGIKAIKSEYDRERKRTEQNHRERLADAVQKAVEQEASSHLGAKEKHDHELKGQ